MPLGRRFFLVASLAALTVSTSLAAQGTTAGALKGVVLAADGSALDGAAVTVTPAVGGAVRNLESRADGSFSIRMLAPGSYSILIEVIGYQPLRLRAVVVVAGGTTAVSARLEQRPPPITSVTESDDPGVITGGMGRVIAGRDLLVLESRRDATDLTRGASEVIQPIGAGSGFALGAGGLPAQRSRLFVDGIPELMLSHPGNLRSAALTPVFALDGIEQAQLLGTAADAEWRGVAGSLLQLSTRQGQNRFQFAPFATWSGSSIGGKALDNPGDSSATSFQVGASLSGALKPDTAHFFLRADYQSLETASAFPWEQDTTRYQGQAVSLRTTILRIGSDSFHTALDGAIAPAVRSWKGGTASGRLDWKLGRRSALLVRGGFASWKETNASIGWDPANDAGTSLSARDLSVAMSVVTLSGAYANEIRMGVSAARRDWTAASFPGTSLVAEGIRFGGNAVLPGLFDTKTFGLSEVLQYAWGRHAIKTGLTFDYTTWRQNYRYGAQGIFQFGDLDYFGAGNGSYFATTSDSAEAKFRTIGAGLFLQDSYEVSPRLRLLTGLRWETEVLPRKRFSRNEAWKDAALMVADSVFRDRRGIEPRLGFVYEPGGRGAWAFEGDVGLYTSGIDPTLFAEAIQQDGNLKVVRALGGLKGWPAVNGAAAAPVTTTRLTFLTGGKRYHAPRTLKARLGLSGGFGSGFTLNIAGGYHHTDFLQRRSDLNRHPASSGVTQEGRRVYGTLVQQGGMVTSALNSSRRFANFDLVSGLAPTGYSDYYELTARLGRRVSRSLSFSGSYTYSRTRDNLVGLLQPDPADQLSPFPGGIDGVDWDSGRSDLDVPHRFAAMAEFRSGGRMPVTFAARGRWRSGLPFSPGFRGGVDVNGDLSGGNDPVTRDAVATPSGGGVLVTCDGGAVGVFVARNSCRDKGIGAVDARLTIGLPVGTGSRLALTVDALNLVATTTGVIDHAAVLIDPTKTIATANGVVTLPFLINPQFGMLQSRRGEPRQVRFGLRVEY